MEMLHQAFENNEEIIRFVDNMSNGNLRKALDFIVAFVGSAHVDSDKIFRIIDEQGSYTLPLHEFLRAVIFGDNEYFNPSISPIINIYDLSSNDPREHFLMLLVISLIERMGVLGGSEGFVTTTDIYQYFQRLGFTERQIQITIQRAIHKNLITPPRVREEDIYDRLRILSAGAYTAKKLANSFSYIDAMLIDIPITDPEYRKNIQQANSISERLDRIDIFLDYLNKCWDTSLKEMFDWPSHIQIVKNEVSSIRFRTGRQY